MTQSVDLLQQLLHIPSPTYSEAQKTCFLDEWVQHHIPQSTIESLGNNRIITIGDATHPTLAFVGHTDTVPDFFPPYVDQNRLYGSGASDMQSGIACCLCFIKNNLKKLTSTYQIRIIIYDKEEGTPLHENGLYECIRAFPERIQSIDVAIVAEPTNNTLQLGCLGSIHATVRIPGKAAHSARPWHGENAVYNALPLLNNLAQRHPVKHTLFGVDFYDVLTLTTSQSAPGRTTVPDWWEGNLNYRFSPVHTLMDAQDYMTDFIKHHAPTAEVSIFSAVDAGNVIEHPLLTRAATLMPSEAKQAWTDVAQLTALGVCAFNFGPGRQDQAHHPNEYVCIDDMKNYELLLEKLILED
jgi:succinyl-diaminopimelate desuccinylase